MSKDGGQAFPRQTFDYYPSLNKTHAGTCEPGMSLRDYFAGQAMVGLVTFENGERLQKLFGDRDTPDKTKPEEYFAQVAYWLADAMIAERSK